MSNKIKELTEKIYDEGIAKAKAEALGIISNAKEESAKIIANANEKEAKILDQAKTKATEYIKNAEREIQLVSRQTISTIKQQIINLVTTAQVEPSVTQAFKNGEFISTIILTLIKNWNPQKPEEMNLKLLLPKKDEVELSEFFQTQAIQALNNGVSIKFDTNISSGFKIGPKNGSYIISFSDSDFEEYFKSYLKPKTKELLFSPIQPTNGENKKGNFQVVKSLQNK